MFRRGCLIIVTLASFNALGETTAGNKAKTTPSTLGAGFSAMTEDDLMNANAGLGNMDALQQNFDQTAGAPLRDQTGTSPQPLNISGPTLSLPAFGSEQMQQRYIEKATNHPR
ncbi:MULTISPECIES: hypothetical protein [Marinobacter]|uniref:Conjugal transfer protein TraN n=1 Tax=Marinobacter salarius TaxID=1420917 RepID=A0A1W6K8M2_9GAMM|nr:MULTISPECIES: hypothetical protein [Marinobacter]ARM83692.1 hypothetical protein MARSALSMR5_01605 [Marinobacter salarius]MBJ7299192.1 hypothetical protein [Marinobacter salarius]MCC4282652.1 hypothetical protein [Marinobacter salarius]MDC8455941.1 hypothetical protein [Marinobacter sp. DS40M6]MDM8178395.1 hypothetical protein [Marinobacter salarius]